MAGDVVEDMGDTRYPGLSKLVGGRNMRRTQ